MFNIAKEARRDDHSVKTFTEQAGEGMQILKCL